MTSVVVWRALVCGVLAALAACGRRTPQPHAPPPPAEAAAALRQLEDEWAAAYVRHDPAPVERILSDDFVMSRAHAEMWTKADYLAHIRNDTLRHESITRADERIRIYGDAAVVTYRPTRLTEGRSRTFRSTDTFIHRDGRWQLVARHITEVPGPRQ